MAQLLNRAQTRDASRRDLNIVPPSDYPPNDPRFGPPGAQPAGNPIPSNQQLNDAYDNAISMLNNRVQYNSIIVPIPLRAAAAGSTGYLPISMANNQYISQTLMAQIGLSNLNDVRRVGWINNGDSTYQQVWPFDLAQTDRDRIIQDNNGPGVPTWYYTDQYNLYINPPNGAEGTLQVTYGNGSLSFCVATGYIEQLPVDHHYCVRQLANQLVTMKGPGNVEWNNLYGMLTGHVKILVDMMVEWYATNNRASQPMAGADNIRRQWGTYRRRRR
jgi:hypothetical protein